MEVSWPSLFLTRSAVSTRRLLSFSRSAAMLVDVGFERLGLALDAPRARCACSRASSWLPRRSTPSRRTRCRDSNITAASQGYAGAPRRRAGTGSAFCKSRSRSKAGACPDDLAPTIWRCVQQKRRLRQLWRGRPCRSLAAPGRVPTWFADTVCGGRGESSKQSSERRSNAYGIRPLPPCPRSLSWPSSSCCCWACGTCTRGTNPNRSQKLMRWRVGLQSAGDRHHHALRVRPLPLIASGLTATGMRAPQFALCWQELDELKAAHGRSQQDLHAHRRCRHDRARQRRARAQARAAHRRLRHRRRDQRLASAWRACTSARRYPDLDAMLVRIQNDLFDLGADLTRARRAARSGKANRCASATRRSSGSRTRSTR